MITPIPFKRAHLLELTHEKAKELYNAQGSELLEKYPAFSWLDTSMLRVVACGGMHPIWSGRWGTWAFLEAETGPHMLRIARFVRTVLECYPVPRVEAQVLVGFEQGIKFVKVLGFVQETATPMRKWTPEGEDVLQFAMIKED